MAENSGLNFYAGIERDYETVQKIFLWLMKNRSSKKTVIISDEFISETLEEIENKKRSEEIRREREEIPHR